MKRIPTDTFLDRLRRLNALDAEQAAAVEELLRDEPTLMVSEAMRDVLHLEFDEFIKILCEEYGSEHVPRELLRRWPLQDEALDLVPSHMAHDLAVFPLNYDEKKNRILVVTAYPFNPHMLEELGDELPVDEVEVTFCREDVLGELLTRGYVGSEDLLGPVGDDVAFDIGADSDEEAFPGLYGDDVSSYLYSDEPELAADAEGGGGQRGMGEGVRGSLAHLGIVDMLQALGQSRKTCAIFVESGDWIGSMHMEDGWVVHAETPDEQGEEAVYEILGQQSGHFEIVQSTYEGEKSMQSGVEGLLLEGMRRLDEANR